MILDFDRGCWASMQSCARSGTTGSCEGNPWFIAAFDAHAFEFDALLRKQELERKAFRSSASNSKEEEKRTGKEKVGRLGVY